MNQNLKAFKKGQSGNPGGRPRGYHEFAARARDMSMEGIEQLYTFAKDKRLGVPVRILAWKTIFERGFGKAVQPIALGPAVEDEALVNARRLFKVELELIKKEI